MTESQKLRSLARAILVMILGGMLVKWALEARRASIRVSARDAEHVTQGEFGGNLDFLRDHYTPPTEPGESNHYIDLWSPGLLLKLVREQGLTNNRTLFVDSHGRAGFAWHGGRYGFYPHRDLVPEGQETPAYSARDLAEVLGTAASDIHNVVLAGCNAEGRFRSREFRRYFVNATNITYMAAGELAFKPMLVQALSMPSSEVRQLHGRIRTVSAVRTEAVISGAIIPGSTPLGAYISDLYLPGARKPFRTQKAGRELLTPPTVTRQASLGVGATPDLR